MTNRFVDGPWSFVYYDDSVNMVWHHDERVHFDSWKSVWQSAPNALDNLSGFIQPCFPVLYVTEERQPSLHYNGHEVSSGLCVIETFQANGPAVLQVWIVETSQAETHFFSGSRVQTPESLKPVRGPLVVCPVIPDSARPI